MGRAEAVAWWPTQIGKPYSETVDGGVGPDDYDCSGFVMVGAKKGGVSIERTTSQQYPELIPITEGELIRGDLVYFEVDADGGPEPQHVGIWWSPGVMLEAPHSGAFVGYAPIPNTPAESILGYRRIPWPDEPTPAPTPPSGDTDMQTAVVSYKPNQIDVFQVKDGSLLHYWFEGSWASEVIAGPSGGESGKSVTLAAVQPQFAVQAGQAMVTVEDTSGNVWVFNQTTTGVTWAGGAI